MRFCRCFTWSGELNFSSVSKPSRPLALVPMGTLCQAENCSIMPQVIQAELNPQGAGPSGPLAWGPVGALCQAENCSIMPQVIQAELNPQVLWPAAFSFLAASNTSGQVFGISLTPAFFSSSLLTHMTMEEELNGKESISPFEVE